MQVQNKNSSRVFLTSKLIYHLFVEKIELNDRKHFIQYKDSDALNVLPSNLILTTASIRSKRAHAKRKSPLLTKQVTQFDLNGKRIRMYKSIEEAAINVKGLASAILNVVEGYQHTYENSLWRTGDLESTKKFGKHSGFGSKPVIQYTLEGNKIAEFPSLGKAARVLGGNRFRLGAVLNSGKKIYMGFKWEWAT